MKVKSRSEKSSGGSNEKSKGKGEKSDKVSKKEKIKPKVDLAALRRAANRALKRMQEKCQQGDTHNFSSRIREAGKAAYELIKAKHPELNNTDLLTYIMLLAAELVETAPRPKFGTLAGSKYTGIKGDLATLIIELYKFEGLLLEIDLYSEDPERTKKIANLSEATQLQLGSIERLAERIARLAMLPEIPSDPDELRLLGKLPEMLKQAEENSTGEGNLAWSLARKLLAPYLP